MSNENCASNSMRLGRKAGHDYYHAKNISTHECAPSVIEDGDFDFKKVEQSQLWVCRYCGDEIIKIKQKEVSV